MNDQEKSREQLIEEVAELRRNLDALVSYLPEAFFIVDAPDVRIRLASRHTQQMLGVSLRQLKGLHDEEHFQYYQVFHPDGTTVEIEQLPLSRALSTGEVIRNEEWLMQSKDGRRFPTLCQAGPVRDEDGRICGAVIAWQDISDRKQAEDALRQSEERYRMLAETTTDVIAIHDRDGTILYGNRAGAVSLGLDPNSVVGITQQQMFPPEVAQKHTENISTVFQTGELLELTDEAYPHGSGQIWLHTRLMPLRDEHGQVTAVMSVSHDITRRKQAEEALRKAHDELELRVEERTAELAATNEQLRREIEERKRIEAALRQSEEMHRTLVEVSPDAVLMVDLEQNITFASQRAIGMFGYDSAKSFRGVKATALVVEEDRQRLAANISLLLQQQVRQQTEYTGVRKDGSRFTAEVSSAMLRNDTGDAAAFMAVIRDVTARKQTEMALQRSHEELRAIYDGMVDGLLVVDTRTRRLLRGNAAILQMLGYSEAELLNLSVEDIHPHEAMPYVVEQVRAAVEGRLHITDDVPVLRKNGSVFHVVISCSSIIYEGRPCVVGFFHDVTERRRAREVLEREYRTLKHLLQSSDRERQLIAYEIHDGLAQQLAGAIMQFETYFHQKDVNPKNAAKAYDAAMTMLRQGHSESRRLISGVRPPILDESGVVAAIAHLVSDQNVLKGPKIKYFSAVTFDRLVPIVENAIYRIVQEALANACQHSQSETARVSLVQREGRVKIEIRDWGVGFDVKAVQENRFGLEGIRQRARLLGGKCSIRSKLGKGTRIAVELPVVERDA
jgi:PAS domain S-box-containing protein